MNNELRARQIVEAQKRLDILVNMGLMQEVKNSFDNDGTVYYSFHNGILYWLKEDNNCDNLVEIVKWFEKKYNALVYHAIFNHLEFGDCLALLYISSHTKEWDFDRQDLINRLPIVYVENMSDPDCSEFGSIEIKPYAGGLVRTAWIWKIRIWLKINVSSKKHRKKQSKICIYLVLGRETLKVTCKLFNSKNIILCNLKAGIGLEKNKI